MKNKLFEYLLVTVQFGSLGFILLTASWSQLPARVFATLLAAAILAAWAMISMKIGNFNVVPSPVLQGNLVTSGPYRLIRHPMYASILLTTIPMVIAQFSILKLAAEILLVIDLVVKLRYEEKLLMKHFSGYEEYRKGSWRILPWIW